MSGKVIVTGTFGLVGVDTVKKLTADGWHVVATAHHTTDAALPADVEIRRVDLTDAGAVHNLVADVSPDAIVHLAAIIPPLIYRDAEAARRINVGATAALVKAAEAQSNPPHFAYASSASVYGARNPHRVSDLLRAETPVSPCELYGGHKLESEQLLQSSSLPWTILRLGGVFSVDPSAMPFTADLLYFGGLVPADTRIHGVDTRDVASAFAAALAARPTDEVFLIGGDDSLLLRQGQLKQDLAAARGLPGIPVGRPGNPDCDADWFPAGDWMDVTRSQQVLSFQHHSWPEMLDEMRFNTGWKKYPTRLAAPLIRAVLERQSPYRNAPGRYADVWGALRARFGETGLDTPPAR